MPYASAKDAPAWVQKLGTEAAREWIAVFNAAFKKTGGDEQQAFAEAGAAVKKSHSLSRVVHFISAFPETMDGTLARAEILRTGEWMYRGKMLAVTQQTLEEMVANFNRYPHVVILDYDHGSALGKTVDDRIAAGEVKSLSIEHTSDGEAVLWATFALTDRAAQYVKNKEIRFCSSEFWPEGYVHPEAKKDVGAWLDAVALTPRPFLDGLRPMVLMSKTAEKRWDEIRASSEGAGRGSASPVTGARPEGNGKMGIRLSQFGGSDEGTPEEAVTLLSKQADQLKAKDAEITRLSAASAKAEKDAKDAGDRVTKAEGESALLSKRVEQMETNLQTIKKESGDVKFNALLASTKRDNKLTDGQIKDEKVSAMFRKMFDADEAAFAAYLSSLPAVLPTRPAGLPGSGNVKAEDTSAEAKFLSAVVVRQNTAKAAGVVLSFGQAALAVQNEEPELAAKYSAEQEAKISRGPSGPPSGEVV